MELAANNHFNLPSATFHIVAWLDNGQEIKQQIFEDDECGAEDLIAELTESNTPCSVSEISIL